MKNYDDIDAFSFFHSEIIHGYFLARFQPTRIAW